jgi:hypothetical protein
VSASYTFEAFVRDVEWRVRHLTRTVADPDFVWPGVLILDGEGGLSAESFEIGPTATERGELVAELVAAIRASPPRRFAWVMPCLRDEGGLLCECLLIIFAERGQVRAAVASLERSERHGPRLGRFNYGAFGSGARRISGVFVEPLLEALERAQFPARRPRTW